MKSCLIHSTRRFTCLSYGNGLAYTLEQRSTRNSILFQGEDADQFRAELDNLTCGRLPLSYDDALGVLWNDYCAAAAAVPEPAR